MRTCKHLNAFEITVNIIDSANSGLPPWMAVCEDCASIVFDALETRKKQIEERRPRYSGKSGAAVSWARIKRLLEWLKDYARAAAQEKKP